MNLGGDEDEGNAAIIGTNWWRWARCYPVDITWGTGREMNSTLFVFFTETKERNKACERGAKVTLKRYRDTGWLESVRGHRENKDIAMAKGRTDGRSVFFCVGRLAH